MLSGMRKADLLRSLADVTVTKTDIAAVYYCCFLLLLLPRLSVLITAVSWCYCYQGYQRYGSWDLLLSVLRLLLLCIFAHREAHQIASSAFFYSYVSSPPERLFFCIFTHREVQLIVSTAFFYSYVPSPTEFPAFFYPHVLSPTERFSYICPDIAKEFNKYDSDPAKWIKKYEGKNPVNNQAFTIDIGYERFLGPEIFFHPEVRLSTVQDGTTCVYLWL